MNCSRGLASALLAAAAAFAVAAPGPGALAAAAASAATSEPARLASRSLLLDLAHAGERLVAVGERGHVLLSEDAGSSWRQVEGVPTRSMLTGVCFAGARGFAVGHDEVILLSEDGGLHWSRVHFAPEAQQPLLDVWCGPEGQGIAVGAYGSFYVTRDGGRSWTPRRLDARPPASAAPANPEEIPPDYHLNRIVAAGEGRLYIGAEAGQLYRSDDAGETWNTLPSPYEGSFYGLLPLAGPDELLAFGLRGHLFRSKDGGRSWTRLETGTVAMLTDGVRLADGRIVIVGLSGTVLLGADGRELRLLQQEDRRGIAAVLATQEGALVTAGEGGVKVIHVP